MGPLDLIKLSALVVRTRGIPEVTIGLIDGPVAIEHPGLERERIRQIRADNGAACNRADSAACMHGTFVAGILSAKPNSNAPAICPNCTLLMRPIFPETTSTPGRIPTTTPPVLAQAITECISAGARIINLSLGLAAPSSNGDRSLEQALDHSLRRGVIVVAAAGNQGTLGSSVITRHPWVIPVVAYDLRGRPATDSNLGGSMGKRGLGAPGDNITSLGSEGESLTLGGTSVAAPFVTGALALLWSEFPGRSAASIKHAVLRAVQPRRGSVVPPLMDAAAAYELLAAGNGRGPKR